ncbi:MAG: hypothetical protein OXE97_06065, partial [Gammaproteobacteria bacterium]|nr:hypothetical protein [Gammaproteobacteria bacterium]
DKWIISAPYYTIGGELIEVPLSTFLLFCGTNTFVISHHSIRQAEATDANRAIPFYKNVKLMSGNNSQK